MTYIAYEATNKVNGKKYIGITGRPLEVRKKRHFWTAKSGRGARFGFAIRAHGKDNFVFRTLLVCPDLDYANYIEKELIALYKPEYNLTAGGEGVGSYHLSDEAKEKISATQKGNKHWLGKKHKDDTRAKMSEARAKYWAGREHSRKTYQKKGRPRRGKPVACNGVIYESVCHAAKAHGLGREALRFALERQTNPGVIAGLRFKFVVLEFDSTKSL